MNEFYHSIVKLISNADAYDVNSYYRDNLFPRDRWNLIMQEVIASINLDSLNATDICKVFEALGYASNDGGLNFAIGAHTLAALIPFSMFASPAQKESYLSGMQQGTIICVNAITETEAGSDIFSMTSSAVKTGDHFKLNGVKSFCSNIREADLSLVYLLTDKEKGAHGGISVFLVNSDQFKTGQYYSKMGLRTCSIGELLLDGISLSEDALLGNEGAGLSIFTSAMNWERIGLSALYVGTMQHLFEQTLTYAKTRTQGGKVIGKHQAIAHKIADMKTSINACRLMVYDAAAKLGKDRAVSELASMCKLFVSEQYIQICQQAMQIHGGNGYMEDYGIERSLRDAHASTIYSGTSEIQRNIIAKWNGL